MKTGVDILYHQQLWGDALIALLNKSDHFFAQEVFPVNKDLMQKVNRSSIILFEILYPDQGVLKIIRELKIQGLRIILVGFLCENRLLSELLESGLDGYILKTCGQENLMTALHHVSSGNKYFCSSITEALNHQFHVQNDNGKPRLSEREKEIFLSLIELKTPGQIAQSYNISASTVRTHRKNIMRKVGAKNALALLKYACHEGLLCHDESNLCYEKQKRDECFLHESGKDIPHSGY